MPVLENVQPYSVFKFFEEICGIPHGSGNTKQISDYLVDFAKSRSLEYYQDELNNVIIIKEAAAGYESSPAVILQGHIDMVCEKAPDCPKDMATEGLDVCIDGDTVYAKGTTLGGDNGMGVAMTLAVLDSEDLPHPRVEAIFTVDEEIGMLGAIGLKDLSMIKGRRMLNLDSEDEGVFTVSCAGGNVTKCTLPIAREAFSGDAFKITVGGLKGGHSGVEIHKGLGNACILLGRILNACLLSSDLRLISVNGGLKDNAIPREATAFIVTKDADKIKEVCKKLDGELKNEYIVTDKDVFVSAEPANSGAAMDEASTRRIVSFLACAPNGIQTMSADIDGLVQTSLNLGILMTNEEAVEASFCVRSSMDSQKQMLVERLTAFSEISGGSVDVFGDYSGWEYRQSSPLRDLLISVYEKQYGNSPKVEAIHAGVECGIFAGKLSDLDCISIGPNLYEIHTCRESLSVSSVQRLWKMIIEALKLMK